MMNSNIETPWGNLLAKFAGKGVKNLRKRSLASQFKAVVEAVKNHPKVKKKPVDDLTTRYSVCNISVDDSPCDTSLRGGGESAPELSQKHCTGDSATDLEIHTTSESEPVSTTLKSLQSQLKCG